MTAIRDLWDGAPAVELLADLERTALQIRLGLHGVRLGLPAESRALDQELASLGERAMHLERLATELRGHSDAGHTRAVPLPRLN